MRTAVALLTASLALIGARFARSAAVDMTRSDGETPQTPFAPSSSAAPYVSLGYREALADVLYVRMIGYFNSPDSTGAGVADLAEAITTLDPYFKRVYDHGANAITLAKYDVDQRAYLRAIGILERGARLFPEEWKLPYTAGQIYTQDLKSDDPAERRAWDEKGTLLIESAIRKPGAPQRAAAWAAMMRTKFGQHERAISGLRELLLVTDDDFTRKRLLDALAKAEAKDATEVAAEIYEQRHAFDKQWKVDRPYLGASMYIILGPLPRPGFDMTDLATGGRDLTVQQPPEPLEPLE